MALDAGTRIGPFEITSALGAGGMGEVYRARDTKLKRDVALKVLPADVAGDRERLARFQREAEVLASLNHPNIAQIHGLEASALVMELVEGEDLAQRLSRGPIPIDEALPIARQIADALEAAHDHGVIHRDLKPANIKVRDDGTVKVLDFGLAKAIDSDGGRPVRQSGAEGRDGGEPGVGKALANSPTITSPAMTMRGTILGTAAYMSPEQAKGRAVDRRADIWAFGCVLYEVLAGKKAFDGEDVTDTLTSVMRDTPDWTALPAATPPAIRRLLRRCLEKDVSKRAAHISIARLELEEAVSGTSEQAASPPVTGQRGRPWREIAAWTAVVAMAVMVAVLIGRPPATPPAPMPFRFTVDPPENTSAVFALPSPDGTMIALLPLFEGGGAAGVYVRRMDGMAAVPVTGTERPRGVSWSADGRALIFSTPGEIQKVDVNGGSARTIARVEGTAFATAESRFGVVLAAYFNSPLQIVRTPGGPAEPIAALDTTKNEVEHQAPVFLPDGRRFFYGSMRLGQLTLVTCLRSTDGSGATQELGGFAGRIVWAGSDVVLFVRGTDLLAQGIGYDPLRLLGEPVSLASNLAPFTPNNRAPTVAASDRVVAYRTDQPQLNQLSWVARDGRLLGVIGPEGQYPTFDLSADGANVAVARREQAAMNIWLLDALKGTMMNRVTAGPRLYVDPRLAPDGRSVIFGSMADPTRSPHRAAVTGEEPQLVFAHRGRMFSNDDWSGDGQWLLYHDASVPVLHAARIDRPGDPPVIVAKALTGTIDQAEFSSDGRRVAYNSSESGRNEVYVVPFPPTGERWQISTSGGVQPRWRRDGRELYYLGPDRSLMAVAIKTAPSFSAGDPIRLFESRLSTLSFQTEQYAAGPDGSRFLFALPVAGAKPEPVTVLTNWMSLVSASAAAR